VCDFPEASRIAACDTGMADTLSAVWILLRKCWSPAVSKLTLACRLARFALELMTIAPDDFEAAED